MRAWPRTTPICIRNGTRSYYGHTFQTNPALRNRSWNAGAAGILRLQAAQACLELSQPILKYSQVAQLGQQRDRLIVEPRLM
jgi:hypothetical protein